MTEGKHVDIGDTSLYVVERGAGPAVFLLHGGPGVDHASFGTYLDPLSQRYRLLFVDQRGHGRSAPSDESTWTLTQLADDVDALARAHGLDRFAVLGHSFGAFVALQHAVTHPDTAAPTILCGAVPSTSYFAGVESALAAVEPAALREQVGAAMERQLTDLTPAQALRSINDQLPFLFADTTDHRIDEYERRTSDVVCAPRAMRHFVANDYGGIEVEDLLDRITAPVLALTGRHDRITPVAAADSIATRVPRGEILVLEHSGHFPFVEENKKFLDGVTRFLDTHLTP